MENLPQRYCMCTLNLSFYLNLVLQIFQKLIIGFLLFLYGPRYFFVNVILVNFIYLFTCLNDCPHQQLQMKAIVDYPTIIYFHFTCINIHVHLLFVRENSPSNLDAKLHSRRKHLFTGSFISNYYLAANA